MKDFKAIVENRRSVNYFDKNKDIDQDTLKNIINLATLSPSSFNLQPWKVLVIKSEIAKKKLYENSCHQDKVLEAPVTLAILGDAHGYNEKNPIWQEKVENGLSPKKMKNIIKYSDEVLYYNEIRKHGFAVRNSSLFGMSIMYSAKYYGIDSHPMIGFDEEQLKEDFDIDEDLTVTMLISLGYRDESHKMKVREKRFQYDDFVREV